MSQTMTHPPDLEKGRMVLDILYKTSPIIIRMDVDAMPQKQAQRIWNNLKSFRQSVAYKADFANRRAKHLDVLRLWGFIYKNATGE